MPFRLFHTTPKPKPIFDVLGTDMHLHLIPGVDDGSKSPEESIECMNTLTSLGFKNIILTPHFQFPRFPNKEYDIQRRYADLKAQAAEAGVQLNLAGIAGEYRIDTGFQARIDDPQFLCIKDKTVLVEFSLNHPMMGVDEMLFDLQMKGYDIILAHPERYAYLAIDGDRYRHFKDAGVYFQCNILSISGFYGAECRRKALDIIDRGWCEYLGTDTHNTIYARALVEASHDHTVQKILAKHKFLNSEL